MASNDQIILLSDDERSTSPDTLMGDDEWSSAPYDATNPIELSDADVEDIGANPFQGACSGTYAKKNKPPSPEVYIVEMSKYYHQNLRGDQFSIRPKKTVEFYDGTFLKVKSIQEHLFLDAHGAQMSEIYLFGPKFGRCNLYGGLLPRKVNEVAMCEAWAKAPIEDVFRIRTLLFTNARYPDYRQMIYSKKEMADTCRLVCRWKLMIPGDRMNSGSITRLTKHEVEQESGFSVEETTLRRRWRKNGDYDHTNQDPEERVYTFGDAFCGAGGMSCGARKAGFKNCWGFDFDLDAINTYRTNFPHATAHYASVDQFVKLNEDFQVDVLHISPPCQPFSRAHTIVGQHDDSNKATGLSIYEALTKVRPRIVTLEQTDGITYKSRNRLDWFMALVAEFTFHGFSVEWKVLSCVQYGVPQTRQRLFLVASCPGERPVAFPEPEYWDPKKPEEYHIGLKQPLTLRDAIGTLPYGLTLHNFNNLNPENITPSEREKVQKWDKPGRTVMAGGNYQIHPDMERNLTLREIACIQTFPLDFQFSGKKKKQERQIGNAVPPRMSEALLRQVRKALVESDIRLRADEAPGWAASSQTICLDGEDDVAEYFG